MHEREHDTDPYWTDDFLLAEAPVQGEPSAVRLRLHRAEELVPLAHRTGTRAYVHAKPYVLEPELTLSVGLYPAETDQGAIGEVLSSDWVGMRQREIGQAQAWFYPADRLLILWECFLEDQFRHDDPLHDPALAAFWTGFEGVLLARFPQTRRIATPSWEDLYERPAWQLFLGGQGYEAFSPGAFVKELSPAGTRYPPSPSSQASR
jgi:hypothetical protein